MAQTKAQKQRTKVAIARRMSEIEKAAMERRRRNANLTPEERHRMVLQDLKDLGWE